MIRAVKAMWAAVDGLKTLGAALIIFLLGVADWYDVVPIGSALMYLFGDKVGSTLMILLPVLFGTLRFLTNGKVKFIRQDAGVDDDSKEPF